MSELEPSAISPEKTTEDTEQTEDNTGEEKRAAESPEVESPVKEEEKEQSAEEGKPELDSSAINSEQLTGKVQGAASPEPKIEPSVKEEEEEKDEVTKQGAEEGKSGDAPKEEEPTSTSTATADPASPDTKVIIVTGSNTGIGLVATEKLCEKGYEVIMACRSEEKATTAIAQVKKKIPAAKVSFMKLDLASLQSVREFAATFRATGKPLHILCNNAGLTTGFSVKERFETEDGFEMTLGVNHLGHFLLTHLLLDILKQTGEQCGEARIVHTSSMLHDPESAGGKRGAPAHLDFENLMMNKPKSFDGMVAYKNSKLANCVFSVELARRLEGSKVTSNTFCPGFIPSSNLGRNETLGLRIRMFFIVPILKIVGATRTLDHGGGMLCDVATNTEYKGVSGEHFSDFKRIDSGKEARDPEVGKKLWDISADLVNYEQAKAL